MNYRLTNSQALSFFKDISKRVLNFVWMVQTVQRYRKKGKLPKDRTPGVRAKTQFQGLGNMVGDFDFSIYVPDYNREGHPRESNMTLAQFGEQLRDELNSYFDMRENRNRYQNNN